MGLFGATIVRIYEQDCHGVRQFRVMRNDGRLFMDAHQVDFDDLEKAIACTEGEIRRRKLNAKIEVHRKQK